MGYGFMGHVGLAKEVTWGSGVAATDFVEALSADLAIDIPRFDYKSIIGNAGEPDQTPGIRGVSGTIRTAAHPVSIGHFLKGALQTKSITAVGSMFLNEFYSTAADFSVDTPLQPYTIETYLDVTTSVRFTGCVISQLALTFEPNAAVMAEASIIGRGSSVCSKSVPTFPGSPAQPFTFDTVSLSLAGAGTTLIETLTVTINSNLEGFGALNQSLYVAKIRRTDHQMVNVSGRFDFVDLVDYERFLNNTEMALTVSTTKANSFQMIVSVPRLIYTAFPLNNPGRDRITVDFEGKGYVHQGSGHAIKISLITTNSSY